MAPNFSLWALLLVLFASFTIATDCDKPPLGLGCPCDATSPSAKQCVDNVKCAGESLPRNPSKTSMNIKFQICHCVGNTTIYGSATCGGEANTIICPGAYGKDSHEAETSN